MTALRWGAAVAAALFVATSCSGGDDTAEPTTPPAATASSSTAAATTAAPPATSEPTTIPSVPTTTEPASTTTAPAPPDTTTPPTTDGSDDLGLADIPDLLVEAWQARVEVLKDPFNDDKVARLADYHTAEWIEAWTSNVVAEYRDENKHYADNPEQPSTYRPDPTTLTVSPDGNRASVQTCGVNTFVVEDRTTGEVLDDRIGIFVSEIDLVREGGTWKFDGGMDVGEEDAISCP